MAPPRNSYSAYAHALLDPIAGPLVGIPNSVPVDTHRVRLKVTGTVSTTTGALTILANPVMALCNDAATSDPATSFVAPVCWLPATSLTAVPLIGNVLLSNSTFTRSQFAGLTTLSSVRGRVVSSCLRVCNVSAANTRNGVFTAFHDSAHATLQGKTSSTVATDPKACQFNAATSSWHTVTYHPVEPDEVDSWVWDPTRGPQAGVKTGAYQAPNVNDQTAADSFPGYMGIWWNGDVGVSQTLQVEMYVIAEFVGSLVQPLVRDIGTLPSELQAAHAHVESKPIHVTDGAKGAGSTGHPLLDMLHGIVNTYQKVPKPIRDAAEDKAIKYVTDRIKSGGIGKKIQYGAMAIAPEFAPEIAAAGMLVRRSAPYAKAIARTLSTTASRYGKAARGRGRY